MRRRASQPDFSEEGTGPNSAASLTRGLEILRAFTAADASLGNQELIERTGLPKATISRLTYSLVGLGYLQYDQQLGRYAIGPATVALGYSALSSMAAVRLAQPILRDLADDTGVAAAIGTRDELNMLYLANCRASGPVSLQLSVGSRLPIWRTAMGLAYLAEVQADKRAEITEKLCAVDPENEARIRRAIDEGAESYHVSGYVGTYGTWYSYINAVGVAFRPSDGSQLVALTCGGIVDVIPRNKCEGPVKDALIHAVHRLRQVLETGTDPGRRASAS